MRSIRRLAGAVALLGIVTVFIALALRSGDGDTAIAISPTPIPWDVEWNVAIPEDVVAGSSVSVSAEAILTEPYLGPTASAHDPVYSLAIEGGEPALEITSAADVSPADVSDGAEWELRALGRGEATLEISLTYRQSWCYPCDSHHYTHATARAITVLPLPGDVDCDVRANSIDAALVLQHVAAMVDELPCQDAADVSHDGSVDATDATLILQYAARLVAALSLL